MKKKNRSTMLRCLFAFLLITSNLICSFGQIKDTINPPGHDTISIPLSVDSLFVMPLQPKEGDTISLYALTAHSASPCRLVKYSVIRDTGTFITVNAQYWNGMLTAICHSFDLMKIGVLKAGSYKLNFINKRTITFTVYPKQGVTADFTFDYPKCDSISAPKCRNTVSFYDKSSGNITSWRWNFGDSTFSNEKNPVHTYKRQGNFLVCLTVNGAINNSASSMKCKYVSVPANTCKALFNYVILKDSLPASMKYPVTFYDISLGNVIKRSWNFGDSTTSTLQNPLHNYLKEGTYQVSLKINTQEGCESTYSLSVVIQGCKANFTYVKDSLAKCANCFVYRFFDTSLGKVKNRYWNFGDGTYSNEQNPVHTFSATISAAYVDVSLRINTYEGCNDTMVQRIYLHPPQPNLPWIPIIGGENNHSIIVPSTLVTPEKLEAGDYIGLFFKDYSGKLQCGGMMRWENKNGTLIAWANTGVNDSSSLTGDSLKPIPIFKNGFYEGEMFNFKIWKWRTNRETLIQKAKYTVNYMFPDSSFYKNDGISKLAELKKIVQQTVPLYKGWNLTSFNVVPNNNTMTEIFGKMNVVVKNYKGEIVYFPGAGITDGVWNRNEGYKIKAFANSFVSVTGESVNPQTVIPLNANQLPYFLPYYYTSSYPIKMMMRQMDQNIRYVQTYEYNGGQLRALNYIPKYGIDQIKTMKPGLGYKLSLISPMRSFVYPSPGNDSLPICCLTAKSANAEVSVNVSADESNKILVVPQDVLTINKDAKVTAYAPDGSVVGYEVAEGGNMAITLWDKAEKSAYNKITLKVEDSNNTVEYSVDLTTNGNAGSDLIELTKNMVAVSANPVKDVLQHTAYPNVTSSLFNMDIYVNNTSPVYIYIYDLMGNKLKQIENKNVSPGNNHFVINVENLNEGHYIYIIKSNTLSARGRLQIVR